jgi:hypothetical protein
MLRIVSVNCEEWDGGGGCLGAVASSKDILSIKLNHPTYMLLDTCFDITLGFANIKAFAII